MSPAFAIRAARPDDLPALVALENGVFDYDRMSARQYRRHLTGAGATLLVADDGGVIGSALAFRRKGSRIARLYSLATAPAARGRGVARALLDAIEADAVHRGATQMRLEVRTDNAAAIALYERAGYAPVAELAAYYDDGADARRYAKSLADRAYA
jgi:ribosomal protein S18 acetylase RimI-like enzyme